MAIATTATTARPQPRLRQPLIPITSTHPSLRPTTTHIQAKCAASSSASTTSTSNTSGPSNTGKPTSGISLSSSQKRPSTSTSSGPSDQGASQGRRKTSRTEKGAVITANDGCDVDDLVESEPAADGACGNGERRSGGETGGTTSPLTSASATAAITPKVILTPSVRDILHRDDLGTGKSPARRLFVDVPVSNPAERGEAATAGMRDAQSEGGEVGRELRYRLAPSPPLIPSPCASRVSQPLTSASSSATPTPTPTTPPLNPSDTTATDAPNTAFLLPGLAEADENGVQRSVHDPGFSILLDIVGKESAFSTALEAAKGDKSVRTTPATATLITTNVSQVTPAKSSSPGTPSKRKCVEADNDKENVPPPRDENTHTQSPVSTHTPKTPGSVRGSATGARSAMPIADWSKPLSTPTSTQASASASVSSEAEIDAFLSYGLTPSRHHLNTYSYSPTGPRWTPGHVRVKSKLAEEISRSPTGSRKGRGGQGGEGCGGEGAEKEVLGSGPMTRSRARGIRT